MPRESSVGWLGCSRVESRPASPIVLRKAVVDAAFGGDDDEILHAHDFRHGGGHLRGQPRSQCGQAVGRRPRIEQPFAECADGQMGHRRESRRVVAVEDQARNLVFFIGHKIDVQEGLEGKIGQRHLGGDALDRALRRDAGQRIAGAGGEALASSVLRSGKTQRVPSIVV